MENETTGLSTLIRKKAVVPGLILGIITLILSLFTFYFITEIASSPILMTVSPLIFGFIIPIIIAFFLVADLRRAIGGYWSFKQAVTGTFIIFGIAYLLSFTGNLIYTQWINPGVVDKMSAVMVDASEQLMEKAGAQQEQIDEAVEKMQKQMKEQNTLSFGKTTTGLLIALLIYFIISLIIGALFKREPPRYISVDEE